jgi:hypothetical protein
MHSEPELITNHLIDEIADYAVNSKIPDDFTLRRFKRDADKLLSLSPADAHMLRGMIACLEGNLEECKKQHELSIKLDQGVFFQQNYIYSLNNLGYHQEAYHWLKQVLALVPSDVESLQLAMKIAILSGYPQDTLDYAHTLQQIAPEVLEKPAVKQFLANAKLLTTANLAQDVFHSVACLIESIKRDYQSRINFISVLKTGDNLLQWIETTAGNDTTVAMNFALCEKLAELEMNLEHYTVLFRAQQ